MNAHEERVKVVRGQIDQIRELLARDKMDNAVSCLRGLVRGTEYEDHLVSLSRLHHELEKDSLTTLNKNELSDRRTNLTEKMLLVLKACERTLVFTLVPEPKCETPISPQGPDLLLLVNEHHKRIEALEARVGTLAVWTDAGQAVSAPSGPSTPGEKA